MRDASSITTRRPAAPLQITSTLAATRLSSTDITRLRLPFGSATATPSTPPTRQPPQTPLRRSDHRRAAILRSPNARTVVDRHLILSRLVDVMDTARVRPSVA
jgi:hypothetical protein